MLGKKRNRTKKSFRARTSNTVILGTKKEETHLCVGWAAKVVGLKDGMALVDASGAKREISAELIDDLEPGDYVMVHTGIAIAKIDEEEAV